MDQLRLAIADMSNKILVDQDRNIRKESNLHIKAGVDVANGVIPKAGRKYSRTHIFSRAIGNTVEALEMRIETTVVFAPYNYDPAAHRKESDE